MNNLKFAGKDTTSKAKAQLFLGNDINLLITKYIHMSKRDEVVLQQATIQLFSTITSKKLSSKEKCCSILNRI
jgi:hypothetical protein